MTYPGALVSEQRLNSQKRNARSVNYAVDATQAERERQTYSGDAIISIQHQLTNRTDRLALTHARASGSAIGIRPRASLTASTASCGTDAAGLTTLQT